MALDNEAIYDQEIAPLMSQIIDICKKHQIPMFATFEYAPGSFCDTFLPDETGKNSITFQMIIWAARSRGNGDRLIQGMMSHAKKHGNESVFLGILLEKFGYDQLGGR